MVRENEGVERIGSGESSLKEELLDIAGGNKTSPMRAITISNERFITGGVAQ